MYRSSSSSSSSSAMVPVPVNFFALCAVWCGGCSPIQGTRKESAGFFKVIYYKHIRLQRRGPIPHPHFRNLNTFSKPWHIWNAWHAFEIFDAFSKPWHVWNGWKGTGPRASPKNKFNTSKTNQKAHWRYNKCTLVMKDHLLWAVVSVSRPSNSHLKTT